MNILQDAKKMLKEAKVASPFLDAELLLAASIGKNREFVIGHPEYELSIAERQKFLGFISRRQNREPVAKIIGYKEFWGRDFVVSTATLDPRPDSETIISAVLDVYPGRDAALRIIDFGTGTGCLLLTLLAEYPNASGVGIDINSETLDIAKHNAVKLGLAKRSNFILNNWAEGLGGEFDLVISNPPYIKNSGIEYLSPEISLHEPYLALAGGNDGLECYKLLAPRIRTLLKRGGYLIFEFGMGQENDIRHIIEQAGMQFFSLRNDLAGIPRCIIAM